MYDSSIIQFYQDHRVTGWLCSNRIWFAIILGLLVFTSVSAGVLTSRAHEELAEYEAKVSQKEPK